MRAAIVGATLMLALPAMAGQRAPIIRSGGSHMFPGAKKSPVLAKYVWTSYGTDQWLGLPTPTIDCKADASGGTMTCTGATMTPHGTPTTVTSPYSYPVAGAQYAVNFNRSTDYFDAGDVGDQTTGFSFCIPFSPTLVANGSLLDKDNVTAGGRSFSIFVTSGGAVTLSVWEAGGAVASVASDTLVTANAWSVVCGNYTYVGASNSTATLNVNGSETTSVSMKGPMFDSAASLVIGGRDKAGNRQLFGGSIGRVSLWSGISMTAAQRALAVRGYMGSLGTKQEVVTVANSGSESVMVGSNLYTFPANVPRIDYNKGASIWGATSNQLAQTEDFSTGWAGTPGVTVVTDQCVGPDGKQTMDRLTNSLASSSLYQTRTVTSSTGPWTHSVWFMATTGTQTGTVAVQCSAGSATGCSCARSDGGACTATITGANCLAYGSVTTAGPVRFSATTSCTTANTNLLPVLAPGQWLTSAGTVCAGEAQLETGSTAGPYVACVSPPCSRGATTQSSPNAFPAGVLPTQFCVTAVVNINNWAAGNRGLWSINGSGGNSVGAFRTAASTQFTMRDSSGNSTKSQQDIVPASGRHVITGCILSPTVSTLSMDGAQVATNTLQNATANANVSSAVLKHGTRDSGEELNGIVERICQCVGSNPTACEARCAQ